MKSNLSTNILILAISTILSLIFSEITLRVIFPVYKEEYFVFPTANQYEFYKFDEKLGWSNAPFMYGVQRRTEFEYPIRINEHGMRNKPVSIEPDIGIFRIAFLGDSFVWGIGVPDEKRFTDLVGQLPTVESLNFAVSGYSPAQYYLLLNKVKSFKPNLVVLTFCLSNDFGDNVGYKRYGYYKPYFALNKQGEIELRGYPIMHVKKFGGKRVFSNQFLKHFRLLRLINYFFDRVRSKIDNADFIGFYDTDIYNYHKLTINERRKVDKAILINKLILAKIKQELDASHIPLVIIAAPTKFEYYLEGSQYGSGRINTNAFSILDNTMRELGIDSIDAVHYLNKHDFWVLDGHYNSQGHKKIAELIEKYLYNKGFLRLGRVSEF